MEVTLTSKCQLTLPARVREHLHVHEGDRVTIIIKDDGEVVMRPKKGDWRRMIGLLSKPGERAMTVAAMDEAADVAMRKEWQDKQKRHVRP